MKKLLSNLIFLCLAGFSFGQNANVIIQVNNKLIKNGELAAMYLKCDSCSNVRKISIGYIPGDLMLDKEAWTMIETSNEFSLHFDYYTYSKGKQKIANFFVDLNKEILKQSYLIINIYDFRDRKYRKWYQWHTANKEFLAELEYPNSGVYIRQE